VLPREPLTRTARIRIPDAVESALAEILGEHHEDAAGAAQVGEFVEVLIGCDSAERVVAVAGSNGEGGVDVINRERHAVHPDLVGLRGLGVDRRRVDVLEKLNLAAAIGGLQ
jgi:hypothetical protein